MTAAVDKGGGSNEGGEAPQKISKEEGGRPDRTLSGIFFAIKMFYRMNVYDSNAETEGRK